ncbi:MAG: CHASE2 domain-containing protein, partial [Bacteroidales bacterium]|nr:CHASE2 domain-containing protein [Bacteroidales bacterium]
MNTKIFDPLSEAVGQYSLTDGYFFVQNSAKGAEVKANPDVVMVDLNGLSSRREIADIINQIESKKPALIALDIIFPKASGVSKEDDSVLVASLKNVENLVIAFNDSEKTHEHSFFVPEIAGVKEGNVNISASTVRSFSLSETSFVGRILEAANMKKAESGEQLIDFQKVNTFTYKYTENEGLALDDEIEGKIVLIGDRSDLRDSHNIPVVSSGVSKMTGVD